MFRSGRRREERGGKGREGRKGGGEVSRVWSLRERLSEIKSPTQKKKPSKGMMKKRKKKKKKRTGALVTVMEHGDVPRFINLGVVHVVQELVERVRTFRKF